MRIYTKNNFTKWFTKHALHAGLYIKEPGKRIEQVFPYSYLKIHTEYRNIILSKSNKNESRTNNMV